jgi:hypothetical protein
MRGLSIRVEMSPTIHLQVADHLTHGTITGSRATVVRELLVPIHPTTATAKGGNAVVIGEDGE